MGNIFPKHEEKHRFHAGQYVVQLHSELTNLSGHFESVHSQDVVIERTCLFHLQFCVKRCLFGVSLQVLQSVTSNQRDQVGSRLESP